MFYRFVSMVITCLVLTACSGADETKLSSESTNSKAVSEPIGSVDTPTTTMKEAQPAFSAAASKTSADPATCPYQVSELSQSLGLNLSTINAVEVPFAGGTQLSCQYTSEQSATVMVNKLSMQDPKLLEGMEEFLADSLQAIPNDPDQAKWQTTNAGLNDLSLHYIRAGHSVDIRLMGVDQADWPAMREKLINLRRIP